MRQRGLLPDQSRSLSRHPHPSYHRSSLSQMRTHHHCRRLGFVCVALALSLLPSAHAAIIPADRVTTWNPGLTAVGGIPNVTTIYATVDAATYGNGTTDATSAINTAITGAGAKAAQTGIRQVVYLPAGNYRITAPILLNRSNVVLRGASMNLTKIILYSPNQEPAIRMGWFWPDGGKVPDPCINVVGSIPKGATTLTVANASGIKVGDVLQLDQADDPSYVFFGFGDTGGTYYKRGGYGQGGKLNWPPSPGGLWRSMGQQIEVTAKSGNVLTISTPTHMAFNAAFQPQVFATASGEWGTHHIGLEDLYINGGGSGNVQALNLAYGWIKNVESDGNPATGPGMAGASIALDQCFRCEIRGCYVHHARQIVYGGGAYGIDLRSQTSDCLVEDNIAVWLDKPIVLVASGGGNVVGYNYVDQAIIDTNYERHFQESGVDGGHNAFPHFELIEGNWAPNIGGDTTHGNTGWLTFFRNYAPGRNSDNLTDSNVAAGMASAYSRCYNFVGNVLLQPNLPPLLGSSHLPIYQFAWDGSAEIGNGFSAAAYKIGVSGDGKDDGTALRETFRHGNFDYATNTLIWDPATADHALPNSLYLTTKPAFFGNSPWPWVTPENPSNPLPGALPAKARYEAMLRAAPAPYFTTQPPMNLRAIAGTTAVVTVAAIGTPAPTYKWQATVNSGQDGWFDLANNATYSGVATASLSIANVNAGLGSLWFRCIATNSAGATGSHGSALFVTTATPNTYTAWRVANFTGAAFSDDAVSGALADPDGAGVTNLQRYAFNLAAHGAVATPFTLGTTTAGGQSYLTLSFNRRAAAPDLSYIVEGSSDLTTWTTVTTFAPGSPTRVTAQDSVAMGPAARRFLRVRVTTVP